MITFDGEVTQIGNEAFIDCQNLMSVTIPNSVTAIGIQAFRMCYNMTNIVIPNNVKTISYEAFCYCRGLIGCVTIPKSVIKIGERAFMGCYNLSSFNGKFASPDGRLLIDKNEAIAFAPSGLESYIFPDNITKIGTWLIYECNELRSLIIPDNIIEIQDYAVYYCSKLENISIGKEVVSIGKESFWYCPSLRHITIPKKVTTIGYNAFGRCSLEYIKFESDTPPSGLGIVEDVLHDVGYIYVPSDEAYITYCNNFPYHKDKIFTYQDMIDICKNQPINEIWYYSSTYIKPSVDSAIDANITFNRSSEDYGIMGFSDAITTIGKSAFRSVEKLYAVYIPEGVTTIGDYAFEDCNDLYTIVLPESVNNIGHKAFNSYAWHISIYCKAQDPPSIGNSILCNTYEHIIYVPRASVDAYKAADGWSEYADSIESYDFTAVSE